MCVSYPIDVRVRFKTLITRRVGRNTATLNRRRTSRLFGCLSVFPVLNTEELVSRIQDSMLNMEEMDSRIHR